MVLGFISLILSFGQVYIARICIPLKAADSMLPCSFKHKEVTTKGDDTDEEHRRLLWSDRRILSAGSEPHRCKTVSAFHSYICPNEVTFSSI